MPKVPRFPRERGSPRQARFDWREPAQGPNPLPNSSGSPGVDPLANSARPSSGPCEQGLGPRGPRSGLPAFLPTHPPRPVRVSRAKIGGPCACFHWGRFPALAALAVVVCWLHTMPARHGGPRVHSNIASRGAGRACAGLGHCGSLGARGACFAPELCFPKRLHHSAARGGRGTWAFR